MKTNIKGFKIGFYKIDLEIYKKTGSKIWGVFWFKPCSCGCTDSYGIGINLGLFGVNFQLFHVK